MAVRERIVTAARELIAHGGYAEAQVAAVAARAGVATGTVYRHFPSKAELFAEVFRNASQHEVDAVIEAAANGGPTAPERIAAAVETFARRALRGRRLAWALIAEPVDPAVEAERLVFRRAYRDAFAEVIESGAAAGELPEQDPATAAAALVGAIGEALVGPVSPTTAGHDPESLIDSLTDFCIRAVTGKEPVDVRRLSSAPRTRPTRSPTRPRRSRATTSSSSDRVLVEALRREGGDWAERPGARARRDLRPAGDDPARASRRTRTRRSCAPTTASATASTRSSSIPPGTS